MSDGKQKKEVLISVDIEATGPAPRIYSMYEIGACVVGAREKTFFREIALTASHYVPEALESCGRTMEQLRKRDCPTPGEAMRDFHAWLRAIAAEYDARPVMVEFGGGFDWQFVHWYLLAHVGENPFGHGGIDIKTYYMGMTGCSWDESSMKKLDPLFATGRPLTHNALDDALDQEEIFSKMLAWNAWRRQSVVEAIAKTKEWKTILGED